MPTFVVHTPAGVSQTAVRRAISSAVAESDPAWQAASEFGGFTDWQNSGNNLGVETPVIISSSGEKDEIEVKLILKGGGCENMNAQYSVPCEAGAFGPGGQESRRGSKVHFACCMEGARITVARRERLACASAATEPMATHFAKYQLFRTLDDVNPDPRWRN